MRNYDDNAPTRATIRRSKSVPTPVKKHAPNGFDRKALRAAKRAAGL